MTTATLPAAAPANADAGAGLPAPAERDLRQRELVPPARLAACHALVIGVGAIGRQVALQLAAVGVPRLTLVDPDTVGPENLACQGYLAEDLGAAKVLASAGLCRRIYPQLQVEAQPERFRRSCVPALTGLGDRFGQWTDV